jgi:hypothetical protein
MRSWFQARRLGVAQVVIYGGTGAVAENVATQVKADTT